MSRPLQSLKSLALVASLLTSSYAHADGSQKGLQQKIAVLETQLNHSLAGLENAKRALAQSVTSHFIDQEGGATKPTSVLLYGEEGTGKATLAKITAESIGYRFEKVAMIDYSSEASAKRFKTALTSELRSDPKTVFFFDGIEKSSPQVQSILQTLLSDGKLESVDGVKAIFIASTNAAGSLANGRHSMADFDLVSEKEGLSRQMRNTFESSIAVPQPNVQQAFAILKLKTTAMIEKMNRSGYSVSVDPDLIPKLILGGLLAQSPKMELSGGIGFGVPVGPKVVTLPPQITVPALEREIGAVERELKTFAVKKNTKSVSLKFNEQNGKLTMAEGKRDLVVLRCENLFAG